jgi:chromate reductase
MKTITIAVVVGSLSRESINRKLAQALIEIAPADFSLRVVRIDDLPLYNRDLDAAPGPAVERFKAEIRAAQGILFVTPEYNRSMPGALKNAIDHGSRPHGKSAWSGKPAGVVGASVGAPGAAMAQQHLRNILAYLDMPTLGQPEVFVQVKEGMFDPEGRLANGETEKFLRTWMEKFVAWVKIHAASA